MNGLVLQHMRGGEKKKKMRAAVVDPVGLKANIWKVLLYLVEVLQHCLVRISTKPYY